MSRVIEVILTGRDAQLRTVLSGSATQVKAWSRDVQAAGSASAATGTIMKSAIAGGALAVGAALAYGAAKAIEFDRSMRNVNSLLHLAPAQFQALSAQVIDLSTKLPQSANTLAEGLYDIASSGFDGAEGLTVLRAAATAASAGLTTTEVSAKAIASVLNAYGRSAGDAADVSDVLFQTVNLGVVSFDELAGNLGDVVGAAAAAKISIADVGSAIAAMTLAGISGAESTTSLNQLITKLVKPSEALADLYKRLGYESGASALQQKGLRGVMVDIQQATGGQIDTLLKLFPEIRAARGAFALMANDGQNYARVAAQINDADARRGATLRTLNEQMKAVGNQWQLFKNQVTANLMEGAAKALPTLIQMMDLARRGGTEVAGFLGDVAHRLEPLWTALRTGGQDVLNILRDLGHEFGPLAAAVAGLALGGAIAALNGLATALSHVLGFMADHEGVTLLLAAALGVHLAAGALAAAGGARALMAYRVILPLWYGLTGATDALAASFTRLKIINGALNLGVTLGLAYGVIKLVDAYNRLRTAGDDTRDAIKAMYAELGATPNLVGLEQAEQKLKDMRAALGKDPEGGGFWSMFDPRKVLNPGSLGAAKNYQKSLEEIAKAQADVNAMQQRYQDNLSHLANLYGTTQGDASQLAIKANANLAGSWADVAAAVYAYKKSLGPATVGEAQLVKALGEIGSASSGAEDKVKGLKDALEALMNPQLDVNEATRQWKEGIQGLAEAVRGAKGDLSNETEGSRAATKAIDGQAKALRDLVVAQATNGASGKTLNETWDNGVKSIRRHMEGLGVAQPKIDAYLKSIGLIPGNVETIVKAAGADASAADVAKLQQRIKELDGKKTVQIEATASTTAAEHTLDLVTGKERKAPVVATGSTTAAEEALNRVTRERRAPIAATATTNSAEATINNAARPRVSHIGVVATANSAEQTINNAARERTSTIGVVTSANAAEAAINYAARDRHSTIYVSAVTSSANAAEAGLAHNAGVHRAGGGPVAAGGLYHVNEAGAEGYWVPPADGYVIPHDAWRTLLAGGVGPAAGVLSGRSGGAAGAVNPAELRQLVAETRAAEGALTGMVRMVAASATESAGAVSVAFADIDATASSAAHVFPSIEDTASSAADAVKSLSGWLASIKKETGDLTQFQADLLTLIQRGRADLAAKFAEMGVEQAGALAHQAAVASDARLGQIAAAVTANRRATDPNLMEALRLAGLLTSSASPLGLVGLAGASGKSVADVYALLVRYQDVFARLGDAAATVREDLALIGAGRQPTGLAAGGIVTGSHTGLYYRWAEPGSGGETLIPHDPSQRDRALALWETTGRIIGAPAGGGGATTIVHVAAGAAPVSIRLDGTDMTEEQVTRIAATVAGDAHRQLVARLRQKGANI